MIRAGNGSYHDQGVVVRDVAQNIVQGFKAEIGGRVLYFAATGAVLLILARFLTPDQYGTAFLAFAILSALQLFGDFAIPASAARYIAEFDEVDPDQIGYIVSLTFVIILTTGSLVGLGLVLFHQQIAALFDEPALGIALLAGSGMIIARTFYRFFRKILQGFKLIGASASVYGVEGIGRLVFVLGFLLLGFGVVGAIGGYIMGYACAAVVGAVAFYRWIYPDIQLRLTGDAAIRTRVLKYAVPLFAIKGAEVTDKRVDTVLVGFFLSPAAVGFFTLGKQAVHLLQAPASALGFSVGPWFGNEKAAGNVNAIGDIYATSLVYTLLLYLPVAAGLAILARPALGIILGEGYLPATEVLQVLSVFVVLQAIEEMSENALDYLGRAQDRSVAKGMTAVLNLGVIALLVPVFGVTGAAFAKVGTHILYVAMLLYIMGREIELAPREIGGEVALIAIVTAVMGAVVLYTARFISGPLTLAGVVLLGGVIWGVLVVSLDLFDPGTVKSLMG